MDYYNIEAFDATGLVKTVFTSKGHGCWLSNSEEGHRGYREVLSHLGLTEKDIVSTFQRHTDIVRPVTHADAGMNTFWRSDPVEPADGQSRRENAPEVRHGSGTCHGRFRPMYMPPLL